MRSDFKPRNAKKPLLSNEDELGCPEERRGDDTGVNKQVIFVLIHIT